MTTFVTVLTGKCTETLADPARHFSYPCDDFQRHAFACIERGQNLLVTAHTGSGKTTIAEYAVAKTIREGKRIVYTSPIKSLSNEKYNDFRKKFAGDERISLGILTGDNKINPDANCLIMTAEILRNALYRLKRPPGQALQETNFVDQVGCVVMDEVHFINDPDRGKVWEETLVLLGADVQLILLSATISYPERFAEWVGRLKQKTINLISTDHRPVPLRHYLFTGKDLHQVYDQDNVYHQDAYVRAHKEYLAIEKGREAKHKSHVNVPLIQTTIEFLRRKNLLQAIFFSFSKKNCEHYARSVTETLVTHEERREIETEFSRYLSRFEDQYAKLDQYQLVKELLGKGVGFHHSGLLPILKEIIEIIFHRGLIKVLFATETFAVGVNMPTRTVVFTEMEKFSSEGKRSLNTAEYRQMSGRAGRRGIDTSGTVIIIPVYDFVEDMTLRSLLSGSVPPIRSQFKVDYQFYLKALQSEATTATDFLTSSLFGQEVQSQVASTERDLAVAMASYSALTPGAGPDAGSATGPGATPEDMTKISELWRLQKGVPVQEMGLRVCLSKQDVKKLKALKADVLGDDRLSALYTEYSLAREAEARCGALRDEIQRLKSSTADLLAAIRGLLMETEFIGEDGVILVKGVVATQINECNALLLTEMIVGGFFKGLGPEEVVGLLAIFIDDGKLEERIGLSEVKATPTLRRYLADVTGLIADYQATEAEFGIVGNDKYWEVSFDFVDLAYDWARGRPLREVFSDQSLYVGNFIRAMLKINNMAKDLIHLHQIVNEVEVLPVLERIEPLIMKEFVTVNSLYLVQ